MHDQLMVAHRKPLYSSRVNVYLPFAVLYFFFNSFGLPLGLTYTALLGPFFYAWILVKRKTDVLMSFAVIMAPFIIVQYAITGVDTASYLVSLINLAMIYLFGQAVYTFLRVANDPERIFTRLLYINFAFCLLAIAVYFTPWYPVFWIRQNITAGVDQFLRLKLFTYEASYYALVFVPLFLFFFVQYLLHQNKIPAKILVVMLFLPLILSFSIGVLAALLFSMVVTLLLHAHRLLPKRRVLNGIISVSVVSLLVFAILYLFFPGNVIFVRLQNIFSGTDTSANGRLQDAFILAQKIAKEKDPWFGIGPGQLKFTGEEIIRSYYLYYDKTPVAIPSAAAETLLLFGWVGFILRLLLQVILFFVTRVWSNYYRLLLFLFMAVYQFSGSFITNPAEYVIWVLAFTPAFPAFSVKSTQY